MNRHAITLMGMSGVGKSHFSQRLANWGWRRYSCDAEIGRALLGNHGDQDIGALSAFLGRLGDPGKGGLALDEFKRRQRLYYEAEMDALRRVGDEIQSGEPHFVNDSTGSLCEIEEDTVIRHVGENSIVVYIEASPLHEEEVLKRALRAPKPIFFPPSKFDLWVAQYLAENGLNDANAIDPDSFFRWVFPVLFRDRLPKYQAIADRYGVTISSEDLKTVQSEADFLRLINHA